MIHLLKKHTKPRFYVHALLTLNGALQYHDTKGHRYRWSAWLHAYFLMCQYPYGQAVITNTTKHPEVHR